MCCKNCLACRPLLLFANLSLLLSTFGLGFVSRVNNPYLQCILTCKVPNCLFAVFPFKQYALWSLMAFRKAKNILGLKSFAAHSSVGHLKYSWEEGPEREPSHQRIQFPRLSKSRSYGMRGRVERWCIWWSSGCPSSGNREAAIQHGIKYFWVFLEFWNSKCPDM